MPSNQDGGAGRRDVVGVVALDPEVVVVGRTDEGLAERDEVGVHPERIEAVAGVGEREVFGMLQGAGPAEQAGGGARNGRWKRHGPSTWRR